MSNFGAIATTLAPSIGVGIIFYVAMRAVLRADRNERQQLRELDELGSPDVSSTMESLPHNKNQESHR